MKFSTIASAFIAATSVFAAPIEKREDSKKTILLTNDDGWAATNIRATYNALKDAGYEVVLVAPVSQRSGFGGQFAVPTSETLETDGEFSYPQLVPPLGATKTTTRAFGTSTEPQPLVLLSA